MLGNLKWLGIIIISIFAVIYFAPENIAFSIIENKDKYEVQEIATNFMDKIGFDISGYSSRVSRRIEPVNIGYIENTIGKNETRKHLQDDKIPNNRWQVEFFKNIPRDQPQIRYHVWISPNGKLLGFRRFLPDSLTIASLIEEEARTLAETYLNKKTNIELNEYELKNSFAVNRENRSDFRFTWEKPTDFTEGKYEVSVTVQGNQIGRYEYLFNLPEDVQSFMSDEFTKGTFFHLIQALFLVAVFIWILVIFLKKYHDGEIWMRKKLYYFISFLIITLIRM